MPTVMLTAKCVNSCEWCFARAKMAEYRSREITEMSMGDFTSVVKFYESSGIRHMILLGGEPLLHSRFMDVLELLRSRRFSVHVSTTGICSKILVDRIAAARFPGLAFSLNSTSYFHYSPRKRQRVDYFLRNIGHPVHVNYTITEADLDRGNSYPIVDRLGLIMKFPLRSHIQFQIAVPAEGNAQYIPLHRYPELMDLLESWFRVLHQNKVAHGVDCHSIPRCAMPEPVEDSGGFRSACDRFMIDIGPGVEAWPCFPLSGFNVNLMTFQNFSEIQAYFQERVRTLGLPYPESCGSCIEQMNRNCGGGCLGFHALQGMNEKGCRRGRAQAIQEQRIATEACSEAR
jgi:organic radical activating enzyme